MLLAKRVAEAAQFLRAQGVGPVEKAVVLEASMGGFSNELSGLRVLPFRRIPHYPELLHSPWGGSVLFGRLDDTAVMVQEGRAHLFEGHLLGELALPVRVLAALGATRLLLVSQGRALGKASARAEMMLVLDHLNLTGVSPLRGLIDRERGPHAEVPPCADATRDKAIAAARQSGLELAAGVAALLPGPVWPTPAESRALEMLGAHAAGMALAAEREVAASLGLEATACLVLEDAAGWGRRHLEFCRRLLEAL